MCKVKHRLCNITSLRYNCIYTLVVVAVVVVVEGSLVPSMRETGSEGYYTVNH